jgi:hypothetical protein
MDVEEQRDQRQHEADLHEFETRHRVIYIPTFGDNPGRIAWVHGPNRRGACVPSLWGADHDR